MATSNVNSMLKMSNYFSNPKSSIISNFPFYSHLDAYKTDFASGFIQHRDVGHKEN